MPFPATVGITGANGRIGRVLIDGLKDVCEVRAFTRREVNFPATVVDLHNVEEATHAFEGLEALIHLAADPNPGSKWDSVLENNIDMTYQVLEASRIAGVRRVIFASTNHTQHGNTVLTTPETLDTSKDIKMKLTDLPNPDSLYAVSKVFGETLGKYFSERYGLEFIGLRIGWLIAEDDPTKMVGRSSEDYMRAMFLSHRDCIEAHKRALEVDTKFMLAYAVSNNDRRVFDLTETTETLGFTPLDDAEEYFEKQ